jgi:hypothetical protein
MRSRTVVISLVCAAVLTAAIPAAAVAASSPNATPNAPWHVMSVPSSVRMPAGLNSVSASGMLNAWAVGAEKETSLNAGIPLILHWNGLRWSKVTIRGLSGPGSLASVSAPSRRDAWILGRDAAGTVLLHWNGATWRRTTFPGERTDQVTSVAAAANGQAWLVGSQPTGGGGSGVLVERWDGQAWHKVPTGIRGDYVLDSVHVTHAGDVWSAGSGDAGGVVAHWNKRAWTAMQVPTLTFTNDVLGISRTDIWVVGGFLNTQAGIFAAYIVHWNGRAWSLLNMPAAVLSQDHSISPSQAGQPRWVGAEAGLNPSVTLYAYFNGTTWSAVDGATSLSGFFGAQEVTAHIPGTNATWAVGQAVTSGSGGVAPGKPIIEFNTGISGVSHI